MKLLFKQRFFSWLDSYNVYDENHELVYIVDGKISIGHRLDILDRNKKKVGTIQEKLLKLLPQYEIYEGKKHLGTIKKKITLLKPKYILEGKNWEIKGDILGWDYTVNQGSKEIMSVNKKLFKLTDTYELDIHDSRNALECLMIVIAIDAANCVKTSD